MKQASFFREESAVAARQAKTDPLFLLRTVKDAAERKLLSAMELGDQIPHFILQDNLYGVDLSPEAVEITQLALWIRSATRGQTLATLSRNIVHGNSLVPRRGVLGAERVWAWQRGDGWCAETRSAPRRG